MSDSSAGSPTNPGGLQQYLLSTASWLRQFEGIWDLDFEFFEDDNRHPVPMCMFARERHTGTEIFLRREQLLTLRQAPFDTGPRSLMVAYAANAELSCFIARGWPFPCNTLDVYVEVSAAINGLDIEGLESKRPSLLETCALFGIPAMPAAEKNRMRDLILSGKGKYTEDEWQQIERYNRADVEETSAVVNVIAPSIDLPRALLRGRYMGAVAKMEWVGLPISRYYLNLLIENWEPLQLFYIARDDEFGLYDHTSIRLERLHDLINKCGWDWPLTSTGLPELKLKTLGRQAKRYPELKKLVRLREQIAELKISNLTNTVGADGFSRCPLLPFWTRSGRNQPSGRDKIFLPALPSWLHGLIAPPPGYAVVKFDWDGQEYGETAAFSGDPAMLEDYRSGDVHLGFGKRAGLVPPDATKATHREIRDKICKPIVHGQSYGMTAYGIAAKTGKSLLWSREVHASHRLTYHVAHRWIADVVAQAKFDGVIHSAFGWPMAVTSTTKSRTLLNYMAQASGGDMMRIAAIAATEAGIQVCAPIHDAFWVLAPLDQLDDTIRQIIEIMIKAGEAVTGGLTIGVTVEDPVRSPKCLGDIRRPDDKGQAMWTEVWDLILSGFKREAS
jgi:DNA polymerase I